jgi:hypothetical protein
MEKKVAIVFVPTKKLLWDLKGIKGLLGKALREEAAADKKLLQKTTKTWTGKKPRFATPTTLDTSGASLSIYTYPAGPGADKWGWLEEGTKVRWAVMSKGFRPKTRRAWLNSQGGRGGVVIAGKRAMMRKNIKARPGIKARNWVAQVQKERAPKFKALMQKEFGLVAKQVITVSSLRAK